MHPAIQEKERRRTTAVLPIVAGSQKTSRTIKPIRSYLKWAGGKSKLIDAIKAFIPSDATRFIEPFVGSGVVALNLADQFKKVWMADANPDLVATHTQAIQNPDFIDRVSALFTANNNKPARYGWYRDEFNESTDPTRRAELFIYLNRHGFNGLCRYSATGKFNVSFGKYDVPYLPEAELLTFGETLKHAKVEVSDFRKLLAKAGAGDFVYCDPPYAPLSNTANFTSYSQGGFSHKDQKSLARLARNAAKRGATVVISNHDTPYTRELYKKASSIQSFMVGRSLAGNGDSRKKAPELFAVYCPMEGGAK